MIDRLTHEQETMLPVYRDRWLKIGLSTEPADRAKAEDAIRRAYRVAGFDPPKQIIWAKSPLSGAIVMSILKNDDTMKKIYADFQKHLKTKKSPTKSGASVGASVWASVGDSVRASVRASVWASVGDSVGASVRDSVGASVGASVWASVGDSVGASVRDSVGASVRDSVGASVGASVWASVGDSVWASVWASVGDSVWASVGDSVWASVRASVGDSVGDSVYGQHDANWLGFYQFFWEQLKIESCQKLIPLMDLAENANWWIPYRNICVVSEKHTICRLKGTRIHCDGGPSILYPDGFAVWALEGIRVPQEIAETKAEDLDPKKVMALPNAEQRLVAIKKIGAHRMLDALNARSIDKKGSEYTLYSVKLETSEERLLKMANPSEPKDHYEWVEPHINSVNEALAWRRNISIFKEPVAKT